MDVTERKQAQQLLYLKSVLLDQVRNAVIATDREEKITFWNRFAEHVHQWKAAEILGKHISLLVPEESMGARHRVMEEIARTGFWQGIFTVQRKDGTTFPISVTYAAMRDENGNHCGYVSVSEDFTERQRLNEQLKDRELRLRLFVEQIPAILWATNRELQGRPVPGAGLAAIDEASRAISTRPMIEIYGGDANHPVMVAHQRALEGEDVPYETEWGGRHWQSVVKPWRNEAGDIVGTIGVGLDVTARKQTEEALRQSERRLAEAQRAAHIGSWERDLHSNQVTWSAETYRLFGEKPSEGPIMYELFLARIHPEDLEKARQCVDRAILDRQPFSCEYRIPTSAGKFKIMQDQGEPILSEAGEPVRLVGTVQDITERKRIEGEREALYQQVLLSREELRILSRRLLESQEEERRRLAGGTPRRDRASPHHGASQPGSTQGEGRTGFPGPGGRGHAGRQRSHRAGAGDFARPAARRA